MGARLTGGEAGAYLRREVEQIGCGVVVACFQRCRDLIV